MSNAAMPPLLPVYKRADVTFERGEGAYLFDRAGRRYLDFGSGIAVTLLGHAHPHLVAVLEAQAEKLWHCSNLYGIEPQQRLAERLVAHSFADTAFFCNSGAEALECAIKMARRFHHERGQPRAPSDHHVRGRLSRAHAGDHLGRRPGEASRRLPARPCPASIRCRWARSPRSRHAIGEQTAAILIEPIQGEGGIRTVDAALPRGAAPAVRRARSPADPRRGAVRDGAHRPAVRLRVDQDDARHHGAGQGPGRRVPDRRVSCDRARRLRHDARLSRLDLRRQSARLRGRERRSGRRARGGLSRARARHGGAAAHRARSLGRRLPGRGAGGSRPGPAARAALRPPNADISAELHGPRHARRARRARTCCACCRR